MALIRHLASASTPLGAIVALSGHERAAWQAEAIEAGAAACLEKPIASLARLPGMRARRCCPTPRPAAAPTSASWRSPAAPRCGAALDEDMRRARALLAEALPAGDAETVAYCAQFLGSVGEMLGDAEPRRRRPRRRPAGAAPVAARRRSTRAPARASAGTARRCA